MSDFISRESMHRFYSRLPVLEIRKICAYVLLSRDKSLHMLSEAAVALGIEAEEDGEQNGESPQ